MREIRKYYPPTKWSAFEDLLENEILSVPVNPDAPAKPKPKDTHGWPAKRKIPAAGGAGGIRGNTTSAAGKSIDSKKSISDISE